MVHKNLIYATIILICTVLLLQSCNKKQNDLLFEIPDNSIKSELFIPIIPLKSTKYSFKIFFP